MDTSPDLPDIKALLWDTPKYINHADFQLFCYAICQPAFEFLNGNPGFNNDKVGTNAEQVDDYHYVIHEGKTLPFSITDTCIDSNKVTLMFIRKKDNTTLGQIMAYAQYRNTAQPSVTHKMGINLNTGVRKYPRKYSTTIDNVMTTIIIRLRKFTFAFSISPFTSKQFEDLSDKLLPLVVGTPVQLQVTMTSIIISIDDFNIPAVPTSLTDTFVVDQAVYIIVNKMGFIDSSCLKLPLDHPLFDFISNIILIFKLIAEPLK